MWPSSSTRARLAHAAVTLVLMGALCRGLTAQRAIPFPGAAGIVITTPMNGSSFDTSSPFYLVAINSLLISGTITGITPATAPDYLVLVEGLAATLSFAPNGTVTFQATIPAGPNPPPAFGFWPSWYPYAGDWSDPNHIQKPILAEIYYIPGQKVLCRTRNVVYDKRSDPAIQPQYTSMVTTGAGLEITSHGLDALEAGHTSMLPQPSPPAFNAVLTAGFAGVIETVGNIDTSLGGSNSACIPLNTADRSFQATNAYLAAEAEAAIQYSVFDTARNSIPTDPISAGAKTAIMASACVRDVPAPSDFELCVQTVKGTAQDLLLSSVNSVDLALGPVNSPPLQAKVYLGRLSGTVNGELQDLFIRYRRNPIRPCLPLRPQSGFDNTTLAATHALAEWTSCRNLGVSVASSSTPGWLPYTINRDDPSDEQNLVQAGTPPSPVFNLGANRTEDMNHGQCNRPEFSPSVQTMLQSFYPVVQTAVDNAWTSGQPNTQQALALDKLFSRWEPGIYGDQPSNDYIINLQYPAGSIGLGLDRLYVNSLSSEVHAKPSSLVFPPPPSWVYSPPGPFPCHDITRPPCLTGLNFFLAPFDVSYTVTTGALNEVLKELSSTRSLRFELRPTYNDLGILPPSGHSGTDRPALDGALLQQFATPFKDLGSTTVQIIMQPTFMPFTWINPDPGPIPAGRAQLTYNMNQYYVDFVGNSPGPNGLIWLRVLVDFYDPNFSMSLHPNASRNLLQPAMSGSERWTFTILQSGLTGSCPMSPMTLVVPPIVTNPCGGQITSAIAGLITPVLNSRMLDMLSRYPAPETYDAAGAISTPKRVTQADKYQWQQVITFYGNLH